MSAVTITTRSNLLKFERNKDSGKFGNIQQVEVGEEFQLEDLPAFAEL